MSYNHYIPRVYQQGFLDPTSVGIPKREPYLWLYSKKDAQIRAKAPGNILGRKNLYAMYDSDGNIAEDIEEYLEVKLETPFAKLKQRLFPLIERFDITELRKQFTFSDRLVLIYFLLWQGKRTRGFIEKLKTDLAAEIAKDNPGADIDAYVQTKEFQNNIMWIVERLGAEWGGKKAWEILARRDIVFSVIDSPKANFILSDNPVMRINPQGPNGLENPDTQIVLSLSSKVTVTMTANGGKIHLDRPSKRSQIRAFNKSVCQQAYEFVFSSDRNLLEYLTKNNRA